MAINSFPYLCLFCMQFFLSFWLVLDSNLVNITYFMLWNVKDFILTHLKLMLLSTSLGTRACLLSICLIHISGQLGCRSCLVLSPWTLAYCSEKVDLLQTLHILPNARHCLCMCAMPQLLQFSTLISLFCSLSFCLLSWFAYPCVHGQSFLCFSCHLTLLSTLSVLPLFGSRLVLVDCLFLVYFSGC